MNNICDSIYNSKYPLFADDLKIYRNIKNAMTANSFIDIDSVQNWCLENGILLNVSKTRCSNLVVRSQYIKNFGVPLVCKVYIYRHVEYILSQGLKILGLNRYITDSFSAFSIPPMYDPNWNTDLVPGTSLHRLIRTNTPCSRWRHICALFLLMHLIIKFVVLPYLMMLIYGYLLY
jgi:hypothetical protein